MTFAQAAVLGALDEYGGSAGWLHVVVASGYGYDMVWRVTRELVAQRAITRPFFGYFVLTDKGKIALALARGKAARRGFRRARAA